MPMMMMMMLSLKTNFVLAKSADPDEKLQYAAFHLDLSSLFAKVLILVFPVFEVLKTGEASKA